MSTTLNPRIALAREIRAYLTGGKPMSTAARIALELRRPLAPHRMDALRRKLKETA
jgi:hypothetical protein